jgi:hypothetical protein
MLWSEPDMLMKTINKPLKLLGYSVIKKPPENKSQSSEKGYVLYTYAKEDGTFDYERYRKIQEEGNKRKIDRVWVLEENIEFLSHYLASKIDNIRFGICHGTRRGKEQEWFKKYLPDNPTVIGTEISDTATSFPDTIQWDFHEVKPEWTGATDFIYSNSFDHSYNPEMCIEKWMSCLRPSGICIIEHSAAHAYNAGSKLDPFAAHIMQMPYLLTKWGKGRFSVREILDVPHLNPGISEAAFIVIQKH